MKNEALILEALLRILQIQLGSKKAKITAHNKTIPQLIGALHKSSDIADIKLHSPPPKVAKETGICLYHGRVMMHNGICHDCRRERGDG